MMFPAKANRKEGEFETRCPECGSKLHVTKSIEGKQKYLSWCSYNERIHPTRKFFQEVSEIDAQIIRISS